MPTGRDFFYQSGAGGGSSSGQGGINYITNYGFEENAGTWATYADAAAATPADGTGGSPTCTLSRTTTAAEVLRGTGAGEFAKPASNEQGEGFSYDFTLDVQDYDASKPLYVTFDYMTSAAYVSGDIRVFVYDKDAATLLNVLSLTGDGSVAAAPDPSRFTGVFYSTAGNNDYRLIFHITSTNASAWDFVIDNVSVSPQGTVPGAIVADLGTETWADSQANSTTSVKLQRVGNRIFLDGTTTVTGVFSGAFTLTIPAAYTPAFGAAGSLVEGAKVSLIDTGTGTKGGQIFWTSANTLTFYALVTSGSYLDYADLSATVPHTWANTDFIRFSADWEVSGWAASAALSTTETMLSTVKVSATKSAANHTSTGNWQDLTWTETTDPFGAFDGTTFTAPKTARYVFTGALGLAANSTGVRGLKVINQAAAENQISTQPAGSATINQVMPIAYAVDMVKGNTIKFQVYQNSGGNLAYATDSTLTIQEQPDFSIFSVYGTTEYQESKSATFTAWPVATDVYFDLTSLTLTPGEWDLTGISSVSANGAIAAGFMRLAMSTTSGNSATGLAFADNMVGLSVPTTANQTYYITLPNYRVVVTATTTYYLKALYNAAVTNVQYGGYKFSARRIK